MEDRDVKVLLGKVLGEIYRLERGTEGVPCPANDAQIFGLLHGFERAIQTELELTGFIPEQKVEAVEEILGEYFDDEKKLAGLKGYYDIEHRLEEAGVGRGEALQILRYLYAAHRFVDVIDKMDSGNSPVELRTFELSEWDT